MEIIPGKRSPATFWQFDSSKGEKGVSVLKNKRHKKIVFLLLVAMITLVVGCGDRPAAMRTGSQDLSSFASRLMDLKVYETFRLQHMYSGAHADAVHLQVRKIGDFGQLPTESEKEAITEAIYDEIGFRVPLNLEIYTIGEEPFVIGKITAIDQKRFLIVSTEKNLGQDGEQPEAYWFDMAEDGILTMDGQPIETDDLQIGVEVRGWNAGLVLESYPGQTTGLKVEVTGPGTSVTGDLSGKVDEISFGHADELQNFIVVDGHKYSIGDATRVRGGDGEAALTDIQAGDDVRVWFLGYEFGIGPGQRHVTQIFIQN